MVRQSTPRQWCEIRTLTPYPRTAREKAGQRPGSSGWLDWRICRRRPHPLLAVSPFFPMESALEAPSQRELRGFPLMTTPDDDLRIRPGPIQHGNRDAKRPQMFVGDAMRAAKKAGHVGNSFRSSQGRSRSRFGRGRRAAPPMPRTSAPWRSAAKRIATTSVHHLPGGRGDTRRSQDLHARADARCRNGSRHSARLDGGRSLEQRTNPHVHVLIRGRADDGRDRDMSRKGLGRGAADLAVYDPSEPDIGAWSAVWWRAASRTSSTTATTSSSMASMAEPSGASVGTQHRLG